MPTETQQLKEKAPELYNGKRFQELPLAERMRISKELFLKEHPGFTPEEYDEELRAYGA